MWVLKQFRLNILNTRMSELTNKGEQLLFANRKQTNKFYVDMHSDVFMNRLAINLV